MQWLCERNQFLREIPDLLFVDWDVLAGMGVDLRGASGRCCGLLVEW